MKKAVLILLLFFLIFFVVPLHASAITDPRSVANNRFGIHIIDENDLDDAAKLLNSTGGDWGYVKFVIRESDRNHEKWQNIFDRMRQLHLIPIVRLATGTEGDAWKKPREDDINNWVDFLNSLNWVTENRYVVLFNEPNHAKEWGNNIDPGEYAWYLKEFSGKLKEKSPDFFILLAGLDASAPNASGYMDEMTFLNQMLEAEPDVLDYIDGWSSHSYPNPGFVGKPYDVGRGSIATFRWEQQFLANKGKGDLPVFILETGWLHQEGKSLNPSLPTTETIAQYYRQAYETTWNDYNVVAVVPFLLNYQDAPFDHFSWKKINSSEFTPIYTTVQELTKSVGAPKQKHAAEILTAPFPAKMVINSHYTVHVDIENIGQSIVSARDGWRVEIADLPAIFKVEISDLDNTEPFYRTRATFDMYTPEKTGDYPFTVMLKKDDEVITQVPLQLTLIPPPNILVEAKVWFNRLAEGQDYAFLVYDDEENVIYAEEHAVFEQGTNLFEKLYGVIPQRQYRLVLTKPYYLPRQVITTINETTTKVSFPQLLPFDPSNDGKTSLDDVSAFFKRPLETVGLILAL
ncbi:hypothetical protein C4579_00735 [Candidatus Microgenomates bacterium]|nr:MAG: hypothetical protein C4579_00735 [Candidatus Microgenomates bacterium]